MPATDLRTDTVEHHIRAALVACTDDSACHHLREALQLLKAHRELSDIDS